jgi:hypothetical protein
MLVVAIAGATKPPALGRFAGRELLFDDAIDGISILGHQELCEHATSFSWVAKKENFRWTDLVQRI